MGNDYLPIGMTFAVRLDSQYRVVYETHVYSGAGPAARPGYRREISQHVDRDDRAYRRVVDREILPEG